MNVRFARFAVFVSAGLAACVPMGANSPHPTPATGPAIPHSHGYNIHFTDPKPGEMEMIAASGAKWVRMDFTWGATERQPGVYDFTAYERLMAALDRQGIRALFILDYANRLYDGGLAPSSDAGRAAFAKWAAAAATHFKGRGILWEMWNEPNLDSFWKPKANVADYVALARTVGRALREAAPGEAFVGPGVSRIDLPFLEACFRGGLLEDWNAVTVHPYRHLSGPESVVAEYGQLRDLIAAHGPKGKAIPILSGEWGFSSAWRGFDAASQGAMLARQWLVNAACDIPLSIWYDWHDDGRDPKEAEHNFGTVSNAYHDGRSPVYDPKPAYLAASTLNRTLDGFRFVRRISPPRVGAAAAGSSPEDWVLLFRRGPEVRIAAWTTGTATPDIRLPGLKAPVRVIAHTGDARPDLASGGDGLTVRLSRDPVYLLPPPGAAAALESAKFRHDWADGRIAAVTHVPGANGEHHVTVDKAFGTPFRGRAVLAAGGTDVASAALILPAGAARTTMILPAAAASVDAALALRVERDDHTIVRQTRPRRIAPLAGFPGTPPDFSLHGNTDGKGDAASTQTLAAAASPPGLPVGPSPGLHVSAAIAAGTKYLAIVHRDRKRASVEGRPAALGAWVHSQGDPASLSCRLQDASGEVFQPARVELTGGWTYAELRFEGHGVGHWGGNTNGIIDWPAHWQALFLIDREHKRPYKGEVDIVRPVLIFEP